MNRENWWVRQADSGIGAMIFLPLGAFMHARGGWILVLVAVVANLLWAAYSLYKAHLDGALEPPAQASVAPPPPPPHQEGA